MAPKSAEKEAKASGQDKGETKAAASPAAAKGSPAAAAQASAGKTRAGSPGKEKSPAKKPKAVGEAGEAAEVAPGEGPASHTRAKTGDLPAAAGKATATAAALGGLPPVTIIDILLGDHRDTVALLKHFDEVSGTGDKQMMEKLVDAIAITVRLHSQAEADVLYPLMDVQLGEEGVKARKHAAEDHAKIERDLLKALEQRKSGSKELTDTIKEIMECFLHHLKEEEEQMVPRMLEKMTVEEQMDLAQSFLAAKAKAPLEPQPEAAEAMA